MSILKISIVTVVYNGEKYIRECIESVLSQTYANIEYIIIDGCSTDTTVQLIKQCHSEKIKLVVEKDKGIYDALNKGITMATGQVIGFLHADDVLASADVISNVAQAFGDSNCDVVYGDLNYVQADTLRIVRKWTSKPFYKQNMNFGWMPPHPTMYLKKDIYSNIGHFSLDYGTAADYEFMLRLLYRFNYKAHYLPMLMIQMRIGGMSNANLSSRMSAFKNDLKAARFHKLKFPLLAIILKKIRKVIQYF